MTAVLRTSQNRSSAPVRFGVLRGEIFSTSLAELRGLCELRVPMSGGCGDYFAAKTVTARSPGVVTAPSSAYARIT
jgi:hypothetical protein